MNLIESKREIHEAVQIHGPFYSIDHKTQIIFEDDDTYSLINRLLNELTHESLVKIIGLETLVSWARGQYARDATGGIGECSYNEWLGCLVGIYKSSLYAVRLNNPMIDELNFQRNFRDDFMMTEAEAVMHAVLKELK